MQAFVLHVPEDKLKALTEWVEKQGWALLPNSAGGNGIVLLAPYLPKPLERFIPQVPGEQVQEKSEGPKSPANAGRGVEKGASKKVKVSNVERLFALDIPFDARMVASRLGAKWDSAAKCWFYKGITLPPLLSPFEAKPWSWEEAMLLGQLGQPRTPWEGVDPLTPRAHQTEAAKVILNSYKGGLPGFLLADEVGLGKTLSAWLGVQSVAEDLKAKSILIVCPLSVQAHWRETLKRQGSNTGQVLILNYERLSKLFEMPEGIRAKSKKGLARRASAAQVDLIVFDESHKLKNPVSARSKLAQKLQSSANFTLWLSATAGQTPLELSYLAPLIAKTTGSKVRDLSDFEGWCQSMGFNLKKGAFGAWVWDGNRDDCARLAKILFAGNPLAGLRRRPQEIAGWPEISRILWPQELDADQRSLYQAEWDRFKAALRAGESSLGVKKGPSKGVNRLVEALRFRQKSSLLRIDQTADFAQDLLEEGIKPAISCAFKETANALVAALDKRKISSCVIDGSVGADERELNRLAFQKGKKQAVIFTIEEGISLHQGEYEDVPRSLLIHDLRWSAIQMSQIEGRTHRNGQFAQAYWMVGEGTVELKIAKRVAERALAMKALSGEEDKGLENEILGVLERWDGEGSHE